MNSKQLLIDTYRQQAGMLQMHLSDFSEADMLVRPVEAANHVAWQLGHLVNSTINLINSVSPGALAAPEPAFAERHGYNGTKLNDGFESKEQLLRRFNAMNDALIKWVQNLSDADAARETQDPIKGFAPTVGHLAYAHPVHVMMHVGQIQVIRRKLGKPILF
jgi:hypothetical protein